MKSPRIMLIGRTCHPHATSPDALMRLKRTSCRHYGECLDYVERELANIGFIEGNFVCLDCRGYEPPEEIDPQDIIFEGKRVAELLSLVFAEEDNIGEGET